MINGERTGYKGINVVSSVPTMVHEKAFKFWDKTTLKSDE